MNQQFKLITCTVPHVGSTLVANINTGMLEPGRDILFNENIDEISNFLSSKRLTLKTHAPVKKIVDTVKKFESEQVYFVTVNRENYPQINYSSDKLIILDYNRLLYHSEHLKKETRSLEEMIDYIALEYNRKVPGEFFNRILKLRARDRVIKMDEVYSAIKHKPFGYWDKHYHIHGSHRGRKR